MVKWALKHEGEATFDPERIPTVTGVSVIVQSPLVANSSGPLTGPTFYASVKIESIAPTHSTATSGASAGPTRRSYILGMLPSSLRATLRLSSFSSIYRTHSSPAITPTPQREQVTVTTGRVP